MGIKSWTFLEIAVVALLVWFLLSWKLLLGLVIGFFIGLHQAAARR